MWIYLDTPEVYRIAGLTDYCGFLRALPIIVQPSDVLAFCVHGRQTFSFVDGVPVKSPFPPRPDIKRFFESHQLPPDQFVLDWREMLKDDLEEFPDAFVVLWPADPDLLRQLADLVRDTTSCMELCSHVVGYGPRGELFSFHDAFCGDDLEVSKRVTQAQVAEFCRLLGVTYTIAPYDT